MIRRNGPAGFPQVYLLDPDYNIIEVNGAAVIRLAGASHARRHQSRSCPASIRILRFSGSATTTTSPPRPSNGIPACRSTIPRDLANWELITRPLNRKSQLDMRGDPDSCGVWAPCLSHDGEKFWLVYTDVKRKDGSFKDAHNYIVTAPDIMGPWSDPIYVNSSGFDPSLFHDDDGRKWFVNMLWDHRARPLPVRGHRPAGIRSDRPKARRAAQEHLFTAPTSSWSRVRISTSAMAGTTC